MARMQAGSLRAIVYELFHVLDEILHALHIPVYRFCQWAHRYDDNDVWEAPDAG